MTIESTNKELLIVLSRVSKTLFNTRTRVIENKKRFGKKQTYHLSIYSKAVQELLSIVFNIPRGKKSNIVKIPEIILKENKNIKSAFIIGLLVAEGSRRGNYAVRLCSASKILLLDTQKLLVDLNISSKIESWINKRYKKEYYSLSFKRHHLDSLKRECRSGQTGMILSIFKKATEYQA